MKRAAVVVLLGLLLFDMSGLAAACADPPCDEDCPADASGGDCAPNCHFCGCCSLPKVTEAAALALIAPPAERAGWTRPSESPSSPEPADILHVPRPLFA